MLFKFKKMGKTKEEKAAYQAAWYIKNKEKKTKQAKEWHEANKESVSERKRKNYEINKDEINSLNRLEYKENKKNNDFILKKRYSRRKSYNKNKEKELLKNKKFREDNPDYSKDWYQENKIRINKKNEKRMKEDPDYRMTVLMRDRIRKAIKTNSKTGGTIELLGCSIEDLKIRFESMFTEGMTWDCVLDGKIQIDHIIPCCIFDLSKPESQKFCFNFKNLQPLWKEDNRKKGEFISIEDLLKVDRNLLNQKALNRIERYESKQKSQTA